VQLGWAGSQKGLTLVCDGTELKILRDNMPFGRVGRGEFGTYYIGYSRTPRVLERMLENMFIGDPAGNYDRILDFSTPPAANVTPGVALGSERLNALAQLVDLDGEPRQGVRLAGARSLLLDQGSEVPAAVEGGAPESRTSRHCGEGDGMAGSSSRSWPMSGRRTFSSQRGVLAMTFLPIRSRTMCARRTGASTGRNGVRRPPIGWWVVTLAPSGLWRWETSVATRSW
jgi:hypothetical protein